MRRPEYLKSCTVGDIRKEIRNNLDALDRTGWMLSNNFIGIDSPCSDYETFINKAMTEFIIQAEYLRDREANNWGYDKKLVDFSKSANIAS